VVLEAPADVAVEGVGVHPTDEAPAPRGPRRPERGEGAVLCVWRWVVLDRWLWLFVCLFVCLLLFEV